MTSAAHRRLPLALLALAVALVAAAAWWGAGRGSGPRALEAQAPDAAPGGVARAALPAPLPAIGDGPAPQAAASEPTAPEPAGPARAPAGRSAALALVARDERGAPVTRLELELAPMEGTDVGASRPYSLSGADGRYVIEPLALGRHLLRVRSGEGCFWAGWPELQVDVPRSGPLVLEFLRQARLEGRVVKADGTPADGARIGLGSSVGEAHAVEADALGRFACGGLAPMPFELTVEHAHGRAELALEPELAPGEVRAGLVVELPPAGAIRGRVLDAAGRPLAGRPVMVTVGVEERDDGTSDADGAFLIEALPPGDCQVIVAPGEFPGEERLPEFFEGIVAAAVTVESCRTVEVVLQERAREPLRLVGRVTRAGEPVPEGFVMALREDTALFASVRMDRTDAEGAYELRLDGPGRYLLLVDPAGGGERRLLPHALVADGSAEQRFDVALPAGGIVGRVSGPDGAPVDGVVRVRREDAPFELGLPQDALAEPVRGGAFEVEWLAPGDYTLEVLPTDRRTELAATVVSGVRVGAGGAPARVDVRLENAVTVEGFVRDAAGAPVTGARVFARDASGRLVPALEPTESGRGAGRFRLRGLPTGPLTLFATTGALASTESAPVQGRADDPPVVELRLGAGTRLRARAVDARGAPTTAALRLFAADGRPLGRPPTAWSEVEFGAAGLSASSLSFGPLPPGDYTLLARAPDGRTARRALRLAGEPTLEVELALGE